MKPYHSFLIFLGFICCAVLSSIHSYNCTQRDIIQDMNQALAQTLSRKKEGWITPDTIQDYRSHLKIPEIRKHSFVYYALDKETSGLHSHKIKWEKNSRILEFQGYADCSVASIFFMSDQRLTGSLSVIALLWILFSFAYFRKHQKDMIIFGNMMLSITEKNFYNLKHEPIHLTPMQQELMFLFFSTSDHKLTKNEICENLWPKKTDASETLYTLIKRLKPVILQKGNIKITSDRGKDYQLQINK